MKYEAVIGLEIHAELKTKTKMFCRCLNDPFHAEPNANICPVCLGLPGALPVMNKAAVEATVMVGAAMGCQIASHTKWDRKNYFYPDLPKGYQISQYDLPLCYEGKIEIDGQKVQITRIHLEEDTGTLQHPVGAVYSLVNYNRSGVPLLELVTEPDLRSGQDSRLFAQEYQRILRSLGVANADMEKGELRVEANISVRPAGQKAFGTKVEVKNLNSFKAAEKAINYEIERQSELLAAGESIVQETRGWHDAKQLTFSQRTKEEAADYRYFPEPDLPPVELSAADIEALKAELPALPSEKRVKYEKLGLPKSAIEILVTNQKLETLYNEVTRKNTVDPGFAANWIVNTKPNISADNIRELLEALGAKIVFTPIAKEIQAESELTGKSVTELIREKTDSNKNSDAFIEKMIDQVLAANPDAVAKVKAGQQQVYGFLVGQVMQAARGHANPQVLNELLKKKLG